jgi:frataxin-like iron-binding protein CyaY
MAANGWQRSVEAEKRDKLQQAQTDAERRFSADLSDVKNSNTAILDLVAHPPAGMTPAQVASIAQRFLQKRSNAASLATANLYDGLSNNELLLIAMATAKDIDDLMGTWRHQIEGEIQPRENEQVYRHYPSLADDERRRLEEEFDKETNSTNDKYRSQARVLFIRAEALREVLVNRLVQKNSMPVSMDVTINEVFKRLADAGIDGFYDRNPSKISAYLLELCKRLERVSRLT